MLKLIDHREDGVGIELALSVGSPQRPEDSYEFDISDLWFLHRSSPIGDAPTKARQAASHHSSRVTCG